LLSDLPKKQVGDKVRFLGCVASYSPVSGVLALEHRLADEALSVHALVDVALVLESLGTEQTRGGEWVNVIGYITDIVPFADIKDESRGTPTVHTQAVLLWSAGAFDIRRYETSIRALEQANSASPGVTS